jgi:para-aminobenzoate synthetase component I
MSRLVSTTVHLLAQETLEETVSDAGFLRLMRPHAAHPLSAVLLSGGAPPVEGESRYSIGAWDPLMVFEARGNHCLLQGPGDTMHLEGNSLDILDEVFDSLRPDFPLRVAPFSGGALGYFAYELKDSIERLPQSARDDLNLPDILLFWPRRILIHDRLTGAVHGICLGTDQEEKRAHSPVPIARIGATRPPHPEASSRQSRRSGGLKSNFSREAYIEAIRRTRHYIREGDVYQVNLSQRFEFPFSADPFELWESLFTLNPAAFYAFLQAGTHQVLCTSMERFLYRSGSRIETRPIKGTRKRGATAEEDLALEGDLRKSPKDDAELSMIVDLLRNDLGRICAPRTIRVREHKRLERYRNVHHLVSIVTGELQPEISYGQILRGTFPGGSITGCPKIRAMEIIDELEPHVRHVYTGSIGYLGWHENMDLNIAIRTALVHGQRCHVSVGGAIVFDSNEEDEYEETLHKGRTLFEVIERASGANGDG